MRTIEAGELVENRRMLSAVMDSSSRGSRARGRCAPLLTTVGAEGRLLLESVPGLAKTLAAATPRSRWLPTSHIQCTPDLLPSDITAPRGLLDEINRASVKTQSEVQGRQTWTVERVAGE